jgi:hypothetical protein
MMLASLGCFFAHLSYSLRTARLTSSFFMLGRRPLPMPSSNKNYRPFFSSITGRVSAQTFPPLLIEMKYSFKRLMPLGQSLFNLFFPAERHFTPDAGHFQVHVALLRRMGRLR